MTEISLAFDTQAVMLGTPEHEALGAIAPPLYLSTTFERASGGSESSAYDYARDDNPNRSMLEHAIGSLEGGVDAAAFASGSAAVMTLFQALSPGDHVVAPDDMYYGVRLMLERCFSRWGLGVTLVDTTSVANIAGAMQERTKIVLIETPSNPQLKVTDVAAAAEIAHAGGALLACDNTMATPVLQRPLQLGADIVVHSTTKYLSGHHDAMGGALVTKSEIALWNELRFLQKCCGAIPSPFACWLTLRGVPSLSHRVRRHSESALAVARFLSDHARVERVLHAWISPESEAIARRQMTGAGGVFSMCVKGSAGDALRVASRTQLFRRATSFGGSESLIEHRASVEGPSTKTPTNLLRLAIGLEDPNDLIADLDRALEL